MLCQSPALGGAELFALRQPGTKTHETMVFRALHWTTRVGHGTTMQCESCPARRARGIRQWILKSLMQSCSAQLALLFAKLLKYGCDAPESMAASATSIQSARRRRASMDDFGQLGPKR